MTDESRAAFEESNYRDEQSYDWFAAWDKSDGWEILEVPMNEIDKSREAFEAWYRTTDYQTRKPIEDACDNAAPDQCEYAACVAWNAWQACEARHAGEVEKLKDKHEVELDNTRNFSHLVEMALIEKWEKLNGQLERVRGLVEKWRKMAADSTNGQQTFWLLNCSNELEKELGE